MQFDCKDKKKLCIKKNLCANNLCILTFIIQITFIKSSY